MDSKEIRELMETLNNDGLWYAELSEKETDLVYDYSTDANKALTLFKQADFLEELLRLREWKEEMISVTPPMQEIGKELGLELGDTIHDKILPKIKEQNKEIERLREALEKLADPRSWFHIMNYDGVDASKSPITGWCDIGTEPDEIAQKALQSKEEE